MFRYTHDVHGLEFLAARDKAVDVVLVTEGTVQHQHLPTKDAEKQ